MTNVTITSAVKLTTSQVSTLVKAIEKKYGKQISVKQKVDKNVIGGLKVIIGSRQIDATIRYYLDQAQTQLLDKTNNA